MMCRALLCGMFASLLHGAATAATTQPLVFCADASTVTDVKQCNALYREAQVIFKRERPWITMARSAVHIPTRRDVKGFAMSPKGSVDFEGVWRE